MINSLCVEIDKGKTASMKIEADKGLNEIENLVLKLQANIQPLMNFEEKELDFGVMAVHGCFVNF